MAAGVLFWLALAAPVRAERILAEPVLAEPSGAAEPHWSLDLSYVRALEAGGAVAVREFDVEGTRLGLHDDLGLTRWDTIDLELAAHYPDGDRLRLGAFTSWVSGSARLNREATFNGAHYPAHQTVSIGSTAHNRIWALYEDRMSAPAAPRAWSLLAGMLVDFLDFHVDGRLAPDSERTEKRENFGRQVLPYPVIGLAYDEPWSDALQGYGELYGTYLNGVDTPYTEGGRIRWSQTTVEAALGLRFVTLPLQPALGYRYRRFYEHTRSAEDDNLFSFHASSVEFGLRAQF